MDGPLVVASQSDRLIAGLNDLKAGREPAEGVAMLLWLAEDLTKRLDLAERALASGSDLVGRTRDLVVELRELTAKAGAILTGKDA